MHITLITHKVYGRARSGNFSNRAFYTKIETLINDSGFKRMQDVQHLHHDFGIVKKRNQLLDRYSNPKKLIYESKNTKCIDVFEHHYVPTTKDCRALEFMKHTVKVEHTGWNRYILTRDDGRQMTWRNDKYEIDRVV